MTKILIAPGAIALLLGLAACTNPYDPGQRALGGGLIGAITGAATTPPPPGYYPPPPPPPYYR